MDSRILFSDLPHVVKAFEALAKESQGSHPSRTFGNPEYERGKCLGLYEDTSDVDGCGAESLAAKRSACTVSSSVVGITYERYDPGYRPWNSSGIVVEYAGVKKILTSAYILGDRSRDAIPLTVDVLLPTRKKLNGVISYIDEQFNIALVETELEELCGAVFSMDVAELGDEVTAVGRTGSFKLMASIGKVNIRGDHLESDDLMSSSCSISERGIGGPLINNSSGRVIGMNFFSKKCSTPFMPSNILLKCVEHLFNHGRVIRPWLGCKTRSMNELKIEELELIYLKFHSFSGVVVKEVTKGSPAHEVGICVGDIIVSCNGHPVSSPIELGDLLFKLVESHHGKVITDTEREVRSVELIIQRVTSATREARSLIVRSFIPPAVDRWPVLTY